MKKVVINRCFGGYSLSAKAVKMMAEFQGKPAYFFKTDFKDGKTIHIPVDVKDCRGTLFFSAFTIPNPDEYLKDDKPWVEMTDEEKQRSNQRYADVELDIRPADRSNPILIQTVEALGKEANGTCADLKIVEIPDDVEFEIGEYDGMEHIAETHRTWS